MSRSEPALPMAADLVFIDFEASSLTGWPIEVGWAEIVDGGIVSGGYLIRPDPDWDRAEWDEFAEAVHGISLTELERAGRPAREVATRLADMLLGRLVVSDAAAFDAAFLGRLLDLLPDPPDLLIKDIVTIARALPNAVADRLRNSITDNAPSHRAPRDAAGLGRGLAHCGGDVAMRDRPLSKAELRRDKLPRDAFRAQPRRPIRLLLDNVRQPYNIGALLRLCDGLLIERLIICGGVFDLGRRRVVQAAQGAQDWVPWEWQADALEAVASAREEGCSILVVEQTAASVAVGDLPVGGTAPVCVVLGAERTGVSPAIGRSQIRQS